MCFGSDFCILRANSIHQTPRFCKEPQWLASWASFQHGLRSLWAHGWHVGSSLHHKNAKMSQSFGALKSNGFMLLHQFFDLPYRLSKSSFDAYNARSGEVCDQHMKTYPAYIHVISTTALVAMAGNEICGLIATYMGAKRLFSIETTWHWGLWKLSIPQKIFAVNSVSTSKVSKDHFVIKLGLCMAWKDSQLMNNLSFPCFFSCRVHTRQTQSLIPHLQSRCLPSFLLAVMFSWLAVVERIFSLPDMTLAHVHTSADGLTPMGRPVYTMRYVEPLS